MKATVLNILMIITTAHGLVVIWNMEHKNSNVPMQEVFRR